MFLKRIINTIKGIWNKRNSDSLIAFYRKKGIKIGKSCVFRSPGTTRIDVSRPSLITIGNNVDMNKNFKIMTHDWGSLVFLAKFHDFINSSGKVTIGNNIYFGTNVIVLKGVTIGDNCIIGAGSIVTKDIPANSVASGVPCKVRCSIEDYYGKRKNEALAEAVEYVKSIQIRNGRDPYPYEMREEFIYFVNKDNATKYEEMGVPIKFQLSDAYDEWMHAHQQSMFPDFESFISYCNKTQL